MAQLRRYPDVLPSYLNNHNMNGNSERVEQREKAKIARVQTTDIEMNKQPAGPWLFPPPRKVNDSSDEITEKVQKSLGDYNNFVKIMKQEVSHEKAPGQTCIGVMPVPATPTENKVHSFPLNTEKAKPRDKSNSATQEKPKGNPGIDKLDNKPKLDQKHKSNSDTARHKPLKLGEKLNIKKEIKDTKVVNKISLQKYKINQATVGDKSSTLPGDKQKSGVKDDVTTNSKIPEEDNHVEMVVKKEETSETSHEEPLKTIKDSEKPTPLQRTKPTPLLLPNRNTNSSSHMQSPQHRDMKLQNILKEMTESVNMPLTGICTPLPKQDSRFPFPVNTNEKENSQVLSDPTNSVIKDLALSDEESDDEPEKGDDHDERPAGRPRSFSSSSSSSSSSGESSDSEEEEPDDDKTTPSVFLKTSMLNSPPVPAVKIPSPPVQTKSPTKVDGKNNLEEIIDEASETHTSRSTSDEILGKARTSSKSEDTNPIGKLQDNCYTKENSVEKVEATSPSRKQKPTLTHTLNKTKAQTKESLPDTKISIKVEKGSNDSFRVKNDSKVKSETKKKSESESKQAKEIKEGKSNGDKTKIAEKSNESNSKNFHKMTGKSKSAEKVVGVVKAKKLNKSQDVKVEKEKHNDKKSDEAVVQKKTKRTHSTGDSNNSTKVKSKEKNNVNISKDKTEVQSSKEKTSELSLKDATRTKSGNKERKKSDRTESLGFDSPDVEEEDSVIDVVGDNSPAIKKKKTENSERENGINGVHKNGHVNMPLGIQLVHDKAHDPTSLIVKIPLSFLKRIPSKFSENLSVEGSHSEKKNSENGDMELEQTEEMDIKKPPSNSVGKRSPSWEGNRPKRIRRDSHCDKKRKTTAELNAECEADIRKVEPDAHLLQAKTLKREADKLTDKEAKSRTYVEAVVRFISCGKALEAKEDGEHRAVQMYSETTDLLRFILKHVLGKTEDKRLLILCLRIQSLLLHKLYRMKGKQAVRNTQILAEHFKATHRSNITSPYTTSKHGSTPSPLSPTPSPAGSVGSTGSNSSVEGNHNQNGRHASTASVTSPVSVSIPQRIHTVMAQHVSSTSKLVNSIDMWDRADALASDYQDFFNTVGSICGELTFHSSIPHIVNYAKNSLSNLHEHGKGT